MGVVVVNTQRLGAFGTTIQSPIWSGIIPCAYKSSTLDSLKYLFSLMMNPFVR